MPIPANKKELIETVTSSYGKLCTELEEIPEKSSRIKSLEGNISICDVIAYQTGWGNLLLTWHETEKAGKTPITLKEGFKWNELGKLSEYFYAKYQNHSLRNLKVERPPSTVRTWPVTQWEASERR